jgi:hypothetical protein
MRRGNKLRALVFVAALGLGAAATATPAPAAGDPEYRFTNVASGRCLDAKAQQIGSNGTAVQLWDCYGTGQLNQLWYLYFDESGNTVIKGVASGRLLDARAQDIGSNGTPVQLWDDYGAGQSNQRWHQI